MGLKDRILNDFKEAFKNKDESRKSVLSMLKSEIKNREIEMKLKDKDLPDEETVSLLIRMVKQRKESAKSYEEGGRDDLAEKEKAEINILEEYLPEQMSDEEIKKELENIINKQNISGKGEVGKLMGIAMGKLKGKAEGGKIKMIAEEMLSQD